MARYLMIAALFGAALCIAVPAHAQQDTPELDGAPPPLRVPAPPKPKPQPPRPTPKTATPAATTTSATLKAEEARLARQAAAQEAEAARLAAQAESLKAEQARLEARAMAIAAEERRIARLRADQEAAYQRQLADLQHQRASRSEPVDASPPVRPARVRVSYDDARRACARAGLSRAVDLDFSYARYEAAPLWFERERELHGLMRMDDRRGYLLVDTVCTLDASGAVEHFELMR